MEFDYVGCICREIFSLMLLGWMVFGQFGLEIVVFVSQVEGLEFGGVVIVGF